MLGLPHHGGYTADDLLVKPQDSLIRALIQIDRWLQKYKQPLEMEELVNQVEQGLLDSALRQSEGNKTDAARLLKLSFRSMRYKLAKYVTGEQAE